MNMKTFMTKAYRVDGPASVPITVGLYGLDRISWRTRRYAERLLYWYKCRQNGQPIAHTDYGFSLHLNPSDEGFSREILWGKRESFAAEYYMQFVDDTDVIFDIGANIGYYVNVERKAAPQAQIYAFEPVSETYSYLLKNIPDANVFPHKLAISDRVGTSKIAIAENRNLSTMMSDGDGEPVTTTTLDTFCREHGVTPTVLRMDTEGYEVPILHGAQRLIESDCPLKIFMETHPTLAGIDTELKLFRWLERNGLEVDRLFLWTPFSDSPLWMLHDKWLEREARLEGVNIKIGENPATMLEQLTKSGLGALVFWRRVSPGKGKSGGVEG